MNPQINLLHLKYFCDAVIQGSISEAAKINYVSQSAVSQAITKLETCFGVKVLVHMRQKFQLTEEGVIVFEQARHIFKAVQNIHDKVKAEKDIISGTLKFASTHSLGMSFLASYYQKMRQYFSKIDMQFQLGNLNFIRTALNREEIDFAIVVYDQTFAQFNHLLLRRGFFNLYIDKEATHSIVEEGILVDKLSGMYVNETIAYFTELKNTHLKIQTELSGWDVVARFIEMNIGVGLLPDYILDNNRYPTLKIYPTNLPPFEYQICAIYNKGKKLSKAALAYLEYFKLEENVCANS